MADKTNAYDELVKLINDVVSTGTVSKSSGGSSSENGGQTGGSTATKSTSTSDYFASRRKALGLDRIKVDADYISSFLDDSQRYMRNATTDKVRMGVTTSKSIYESRKKDSDDLHKRSFEISRYLENNKDELDEDAYKSLKDYLDAFDRTSSQSIYSFYKNKEFFSQFKTQDEYDQYVTQKEAYEAKVNLDLDNAAKEIKDLEAKRDDYYWNHDYDAGSHDERVAFEQSLEEMDKEIAQKKQYLNQARHIQEGAKLSSVSDPFSDNYDHDFRDLSKYSTTIKESTSWWQGRTEDTQYEWINNNNGFRDSYEKDMDALNEVAAATTQSSFYVAPTESAYRKKGYDHLTKDEIAIYNYYYAKDGKEKAQEYLDSIQETLNYRKATEMYGELEDHTAQELIFGVEAGLNQFTSGISNFFNTKDDYIPQSAVQMTSGMVREDLADAGAKLPDWMGGASLGQVGYDAITTTANMAPSILTSVAVGILNPVAGQVAGQALMGMSAAGGAYQEALNEGYDKNQARAYGLLVGASEIVMEKVLGGISALGGNILGKTLTKNLSNADTALKMIAKNLGASMLSEFSEEYLQEVLTPVFKNLTLGTNEDVKLFSAEALYSGILGALTAGIMEGPTAIAGEGDAHSTGKQLQKSDVSAQRLAEIGKTFSADTVAFKLAGKVDENTSAYTMGRLFNEIGATLTEQNKSDIAHYLTTNSNMTSEIAQKNAEILADIVDGVEVSDVQMKMIEKNPVLASAMQDVIINPNSTVNQRKRGFNDVLKSLANEMAGVDASATEQTAPGQENQSDADEVVVENKQAAQSEYETSADGKNIIKSTGETVDIKEIATIKDGQMTLRLTDGRTVDAKDVSYASQNDALVYETVANMGVNPAAANVLVNAYNPDSGVSASIYAHGIKEAYRYGQYSYPMQELARGPFSSMLTEQQRNTAYKLGKMFSGEQVAQAQATVKKSLQVANKKATAGKKVGKVHFDGNRSSLTERQETSLSTLETIADVLGVQIHVFESQVGENGKRIGANGWYDPKDNSIHIDLHAGVSGEATMLFTAAHELTHFIKQWSPAKFKTLANFLMKEYGQKGVSVDVLVHNQIAKAKRNGRTLTYDEAYEEVIADSMETMLSDGNVMEKLAKLKQQDKSLWQKIKDFISDLADKIRKVYEGLTPDSEEGRYVAEMKDAIEALQNLFVEGLVDASENYQAAEQMGIEVDADTESISPAVVLSERTWTESDYVQERTKAAKEIAKAIGVSEKKAKAYIDSVNSIAKMIAEDRVRLDYFSSPGRSSFVGNVEYGGSFDFSTLCKKRRLLTGTFTAIQKALPNTALTADEILDIRNRMKDAGLEVSCGLCYVEGSRANMGQFAKEFLKLYKQYYPDAWQPNMADVNTPDGIEWVRINHPECYEQYEYFWNHYGTMKPGDKNLFASQQKPKLYQLHTEYKGEILDKFKDDGNVEDKNLNGGIRLQSFSDFEIVHLIDTMQIIMDMSRVGLAGQAYTKVPDFAWALGDTGLKINLSLIAKGVDADGKLVFDDIEGMPIGEAMRLRDRYSANVGTILVAFNDEQLMAAMADDRVDYIIPFHRSQWKKSQYGAMGLPAKTKDYTYMQNEKFIKPQYHEYRGRMVKDKATNYMPNEYWDFSKSGKENAEAYLEMCARNNKRPKFYKLLQNNGDGSYSLKTDGSTDGYWKLLIDFKMYDNEGNGSPQMPVKPEFNMDEAKRMLNDYQGGHSNFPVAQGIVDEFVQEYKDSHKGVKFSERDELSPREYNRLTTKKPINVSKQEWEMVKSQRKTKYSSIDEDDIPVLDFFKIGDYRTINKGYIYCIRNSGPDSFSVVMKKQIIPDIRRITREVIKDENRRGNETADSSAAAEKSKRGPDRGSGERSGNRRELPENDRGTVHTGESQRDLHARKSNADSGTKLKLSDRDSDGNSLTKEQSVFFAQSKARNDDGSLMVLYHGTANAGFTVPDPKKFSYDKTSFFLTSNPNTARSYSGSDEVYAPDGSTPATSGGKNYKVYANLKNPLIVDAERSDWSKIKPAESKFEYVKLLKYRDVKKPMFGSPFTIKLEVKERGQDAKVVTFDNYNKYMDYIGNGHYKIVPRGEKVTVGKTYHNVGGQNNWNTMKYSAYAKEHGYDGVIFKNLFVAGKSFDPQKDQKTYDTVVVAFDGNQVKSVNNLNPTSNPDIRYSDRNRGNDSTGKKLTQGQQDFFAESQARTEDGSLVRLYHTSPTAGFTTFEGGKGEGFYKFGKYGGGITYFTDNQKMSSSYSPYIELLDMKRLDTFADAQKWLSEKSVGSFEIRKVKGTYVVYDIDYKETVPGISYTSERDLLRNLKRDIQMEYGDPEAGGQYEGYANIKNPLVVDAEGHAWNDIQYETTNVDSIADFRDEIEKLSSEEKAFLKGKYDDAILQAKNSEDSAEDIFFDSMYRLAPWETDQKEMWSSIQNRLFFSNSKLQDKKTRFFFDAISKNFNTKGIPVEFTSTAKKPHTTNDIVFKALEDGNYDGVIIKNVIDYGGNGGIKSLSTSDYKKLKPGNLYVIFNSNQFKNADNLNPTDDPDIRYSDRDTESVSNRSLLANALESVAKNDIERKKIQEYKEKIGLINAEEKKLRELNKQIKDMTFSKGQTDIKKARALQFDAQQAANRINTYDRQLLRLEASKPLKDVLTREKKMAFDRGVQRGKEALEAYRERAEKKQQETIERYQESRKRGVENRQKTAMRQNIRKTIRDLDKILNRGDKTRNVKEDMKDFVADALASAEILFTDNYSNEDMVRNGVATDLTPEEAKLMNEARAIMDEIAGLPTGYEGWQERQETEQKLKGRLAYRMTKLKDVFVRERARLNKTQVSEVLGNLADSYGRLQNSEFAHVQGAYHESVHEYLKMLQEDVGGTIIKDMTLGQLEELHKAYTMVMTTVRNANRMFAENLNNTRDALANRVMFEVHEAGGEHGLWTKAGDKLNSFSWNNEKPVYAFERIGSNTLKTLYGNIRKGQDGWAVDIQEANDFRMGMYKKYKHSSWDTQKQYKFTSSSGIDFELNLDQIMSLYAYSKRAQAHDHLLKGGFVFDGNTEVVVNKKGIKMTFLNKNATAYNVSFEILENIISKLTPEQKAFVDDMQEYLSTTMGEKGNEVSMELYGVKLFNEKFYFPLRSAGQYMEKAKEADMKQKQGQVNIANSGFSKAVKIKASNPVVLTGFMDVWAGHVNEMSMYHSFVLPMEDFRRVYNYSSPHMEGQQSASVNGVIQNAYGAAATDYIDRLYRDLNGGAITDNTAGPINKLMNLFKKGAVFASASVTIQQPSAIARATALVDIKHFIGPKVDAKRHKALWEEVKQYAPVAVIKEMGFFDTNMGRSATDFLTAEEYSGIKEKALALVKDEGYRDEQLSKAPALADELTWCVIWEAVKRETKARNPKLNVKSEEFLKIAGDRFSEVIDKTQVYDSVLARSANMRSKDTGMKMATAFMAEPTTSINMVADALRKGKKGNKKQAARIIGSVVSSVVLNSFLVAWVYAARDDDEDETFREKYLSSFISGIIDGVNPMTYIPFLKDIVSIVQGYDIERSDMAVISDLWNAYKQLEKDDVSVWRKVEGFAGSICQIFGLPVKNIMRDVRSVFQAYNTIFHGEEDTTRGTAYAIVEGITGDKPSNSEQLYKARSIGDEAHAARVEARYDDEDSANAAVRQAIKDRYMDDELTLAQATMQLTQYAGMKADEAYWLMDGWKHRKETGSDDGYSKYNDFYEAVQTGKNLKAVIKEYTDNGVKKSTLSGQITSHFKDEYVAMSAGERANIKGYLLNAYEQCGVSRESAEEKLRGWDFEAKYGGSYEEIVADYKNGAISESTMRNILADKGYSKSDIEDKISDWNVYKIYGYEYSKLDDAYRAGELSREEFRQAMIDNGTFPAKADQAIITYDWMRDNAQYGLEYSDAAKYAHPIENYGKSLADVGLDPDIYLEYKELKKGCKGVDADNDGTADSGTLRTAKFEMIDSLPITNDQKDALAAIDYSMKSVNRYAPWH